MLWNTADGSQLQLVAQGAATDPRYLRHQYRAAIDQQLWETAAQHEQGQGLQHVVACLAGASWPLQRQHECPRKGEAPVDPTCLRCDGGHPETCLHRHWSCVGNKLDHPHEHNWLSRRAQSDASEPPCLWLRRLLPASLTIGLLPPPDAVTSAMVFGAGGASTEGYLVRNHLPFGILTAVEENMHRRSDSFERDGAQWQSRIRCLPAACGGVGSSVWTAPR